MSFDIKKSAIKLLLPTVIDFLPVLDQAIDDYRNEWAKKVSIEDGEDVVGILFSKDKKTYINICVLTPDNKVKTELISMLFSDFVIKIIDEFKKS
jgi:hypothetical protein